MVIKFQYANKEQYIKFDGKSYMPSIIVVRDGKEEYEPQSHFIQLGNAINWVIKNEIGSKEEEISLLAFVTRYELAVKEIVSLKEEDFEF